MFSSKSTHSHIPIETFFVIESRIMRSKPQYAFQTFAKCKNENNFNDFQEHIFVKILHARNGFLIIFKSFPAL